MIFSIIVLLVAMLAGGVAAISGFGIGSLLTPVLALDYGTQLVSWVCISILIEGFFCISESLVQLADFEGPCSILVPIAER